MESKGRERILRMSRPSINGQMLLHSNCMNIEKRPFGLLIR